jgi:hypothetical protein
MGTHHIMPPNRYRGPPMTLANMRENGVRSLSVTCKLCHHEAVMNVDAFDDAVPVPADGLYRLRDYRRIRPAELAGAVRAREPDRRAEGLRTLNSIGVAFPVDVLHHRCALPLIDQLCDRQCQCNEDPKHRHDRERETAQDEEPHF